MKREAIRNEVNSTLHKVFPGIHLSTAQAGSPNVESIAKEPGNTFTSVIDLAESVSRSAPLAIAGSDVSIASTSNGGKASAFSRLSGGTDAASVPSSFTMAQWRPKEPPCFYGKSTEDVHTWASLVRHYLTFMGGKDAQQVAYSITLLRDSAHEWYMGYERRNHAMPRDWAQLSSALLEQFGSNIRSQEAQSQLMAIS